MSRKKKLYTFVVDRRELATILAALRFHQDENLQNRSGIPDKVIKDIATDEGTLKPLDLKAVNRLCEKINTCDDVSIDAQKKDHVLIVTDRGTVVYVRTYGTRTAAKKGLLKYLKEEHGYDGRKSISAVSEWIAEEAEHLNVDIVRQDILDTNE
jgi:hypothetical protein